MMRRTMTVLAMVSLLLALSVGVALAAQITCPVNGECRGSEQDDLIVGTDEQDKILSLDGRDAVFGGGGDDTIKGGKGDDGDDTPNTEGVAPALFGDAGNDEIFGGEGVDDLEGGTGNDKLFGGEGDDEELDGGPDDDVINGGKGNDGTDAHGEDSLKGEGGKNVVRGEEGNDQINASTPEADGGDVEKIFGGKDNDVVVANDGVKDIIDCGEGEKDQVLFDESLDELKDCEVKFPAEAKTAGEPDDDQQQQQQQQ